MRLTRIVIPTLLFSFMLASVSAQTVKVKSASTRVKGSNLDGREVELDAQVKEVEDAFVKYLRSLGKVKQTDGLWVLTESSLSPNAKTPIYCSVKSHASHASAWLGIDEAEWGDESRSINESLDKTLHQFGVTFYRNRVQLEIDETERALQAVDKQQQRFVNESKTLTTRLEDNKREKVQLDKSLETNKLEYETLLKKLEKNKHNQDSIAVANEQIRKVLEAQKEKQRKIN